MKNENFIDKVAFFVFIFFLVWFYYFIFLIGFVFFKNKLDFNQTTKWIINLYDSNEFYYYFFAFLPPLLSEELRTFNNMFIGVSSLVCWIIICFFFYTFFMDKN